MAERKYFISDINQRNLVYEGVISFKYHTGFSIVQKQKSIKEMHKEINLQFPDANILEISSKSNQSLGISLSAFNLKYRYNEKLYSVENLFQSSKVFKLGGPYKDLLNKSSRDAKMDTRLRDSGDLLRFELNDFKWGLEPKTMFYDWIYINALYQYKEMYKKVLEYDIFTDIEFNHKKSINCQARSVALFKSLLENNILEDIINSKEGYIKWRQKQIDFDENNMQLDFFDL